MPQVHKVKVLNPKSRKAAKKIRQIHQKERINLKHKVTDSKQSVKLSKYIWFKNQVLEDIDKKCYTSNEVHEIISKYLQRFDSEDQICEVNDNGSHKIDQSISIGVDFTRMYVSEESNEYKSTGLLIPDLLSKSGVELLKNWTVDKAKMQQVPMIKFRQPKKVNME